jgi:hypothetical protein
MTKSSRLFAFPDVNAWVAFTYEGHVHGVNARKWFQRLAPTSRLFVCRLTQLGLLRLLNEPAVMGSDKAKSQRMPGRPTVAGSRAKNARGFGAVVMTADLAHSASQRISSVRSGLKLLHFGARGAPRAVLRFSRRQIAV